MRPKPSLFTLLIGVPVVLAPMTTARAAMVSQGSQADCSYGLDVAWIRDVSTSMQARARHQMDLGQLDTLTQLIASCIGGGGILVTVVGRAPDSRLASESFEPVPQMAKRKVQAADTTGPFRLAHYRRLITAESLEVARLVASRAVRVEQARRAFMDRARGLFEGPNNTARRSPVCAALLDATQFFARRRAGHTARHIVVLDSDLIPTDSKQQCPTTINADVVLQLTDPSAEGVQLTPRPVRVFSFIDVMASLPPPCKVTND